MGKSSNCPNCGALIEFKFAQAVQTTCEYCNSILVRHDVDLKKVGEVAELPPDASPIQILTEGIYGNQAFVVLGRIIYEYEQGSWNEWHCVTNTGESIWLSDAMAQYAITRLTEVKAPLPAADSLRAGHKLTLNGLEYEMSTITRAKYRGVQGELPFEYWDKDEAVFGDLRTQTAKFGTIDYTEDPPLLFTGEYVEFDALRLKNLKEFEGW